MKREEIVSVVIDPDWIRREVPGVVSVRASPERNFSPHNPFAEAVDRMGPAFSTPIPVSSRKPDASMEETRRARYLAILAPSETGSKVLSDVSTSLIQAGLELSVLSDILDELELELKEIRIENISGKQKIILSGKKAGVRKITPGTMYLTSNVKVASLGLSMKTAAVGISKTAILSIVLFGYEQIDEFLYEKSYDWKNFFGAAYATVSAAILSAVAGKIMAAIAVGGATLVGVASVPFALVAGVAIVAGIGAGIILESFGVVDKLESMATRALEIAESGFMSSAEFVEDSWEWAGDTASDVYEDLESWKDRKLRGAEVFVDDTVARIVGAVRDW